MAATCFPCGFPTGHSRVDPVLGRLWPRCVNAEPGTFGHECGKPAAFIGTKLATGAQACFCADCKERGHEARGFGEWQVVDLAGQGAPLIDLQQKTEPLEARPPIAAFGPAAHLEMGKAATRRVSPSGRVMVGHVRMQEDIVECPRSVFCPSSSTNSAIE